MVKINHDLKSCNVCISVLSCCNIRFSLCSHGKKGNRWFSKAIMRHYNVWLSFTINGSLIYEVAGSKISEKREVDAFISVDNNKHEESALLELLERLRWKFPSSLGYGTNWSYYQNTRNFNRCTWQFVLRMEQLKFENPTGLFCSTWAGVPFKYRKRGKHICADWEAGPGSTAVNKRTLPTLLIDNVRLLFRTIKELSYVIQLKELGNLRLVLPRTTVNWSQGWIMFLQIDLSAMEGTEKAV